MEFIKIIPLKAEKRGIRVSVPIERSSMGIKSVGFACHLKGRKLSPLRVREED